MSADGLYPVPDDLDLGVTVRGFAVGQVLFDRYKLDSVLGRGGMGVVWLAHDQQLERAVALKFLPDLVAIDPEAISDLKRETRRSLELTHPHIVRIYDFVQDSAWACISMEYVDGKTLSALKVEQPGSCFGVDELMPWVRQLLDALDYAHTRAKVVHRDLKPANLMINGVGELKVADFGIAKSLSDSVSRVTLRTGTSGTLVYMSPQQAQGRAPTTNDDIYSLGATIYDLIAGKPPFYSGNIQHQLETITPISMAERRAELGYAGTEIPPRWEKTIAACLAKEPIDRPKSVREVAKQLGLVAGMELESTPPQDQPPIAISTPPPAGGKSKVPVFAAFIVLLLVLGGLGYYFGVMAPAEKARQAEIAKQEAIEKEKEAEAKAAADAAEKARLEAEAQKAAADAEALRTQQEKAKEEADRLAAARGGVMVKTDPEGATIAIGGEDVQTSPATFKSLHLGKYPVHVTLDGYEPVEQEVEVKENDFADMGTISLVRSKGTLQIVTTPPDASYTISNATLGINKSGQAPDTLKDLPVGTYDVTVKRGDWSIPGTTTVKRNDTVVYSPEFTYGSATVTSTPSGATVSENGKDLGTTPATLSQLRTGSHTFTMNLSGYKPGTVTVDIGANAAVPVVANLDKIVLGSASVTSEPSGATVSEHGRELGQTPLTLKELSLGQHTFSFALQGYKTTSSSTDIASDSVSNVSATLEKKVNFAGVWDGTVYVKSSNGDTGSFGCTLTIPSDESTVTESDRVADNVPGEHPARREGDLLTWSMAQRPSDDGTAPSHWKASFTLRLLSGGRVSYEETRNWFSGPNAGVTNHISGILTKQ